RPAMIIKSDWRGDPRNTSEPKRAISQRPADMDIISMAQQAKPKLIGQMELRRAQLTTKSSQGKRKPWSERTGVSLPGRSSVTFGPSEIAMSFLNPIISQNGHAGTAAWPRLQPATKVPLLRVGRLHVGVAVDVALEPVDLPVEALHQVLRLAGTRQVVILARKQHQLRRHAVILQRTEPLLALLDRHTEIVIRVQDQR